MPLSFYLSRPNPYIFVLVPWGSCNFDMDFCVRQATASDCKEILRLIQELADFELMPEGPKLTEEQLIEDGFGNRQYYKCIVAEHPISKDQLIGYVIYNFTYSTWEGRSIYMEDIFVEPSFRMNGLATKMWAKCVQDGLDNGCKRCNFNVLSWNVEAQSFYFRHGAINLAVEEGWSLFRLKHDKMLELVDKIK